MNILLVEDDRMIAALLLPAMSEAGHVVEQESSVAGLRRRLAGPAPDVVILDWLLSDGPVGEAGQELLSAWPTTRVIISTAYTASELPPLGFEVLLKPYSIELFMSVLERH